jgi:hypothetical protein
MFATDISESYNKNLPNSYIEMYEETKKNLVKLIIKLINH